MLDRDTKGHLALGLGCHRPSTTRGPRSEARRRFALAVYAAFLGTTLW